MKLSLLLIISAVYMFLLGIGFIFVPQMIGIGAVPADPSPALIAYLRVFGSTFIAIGVLNWTSRNAEASATRDAIVLANTVGFGLARPPGSLGSTQWWTSVGVGVRRHSSDFDHCFYYGRTRKYVDPKKLAM